MSVVFVFWFRVLGFGFQVSHYGFRVFGFKFRDWGPQKEKVRMTGKEAAEVDDVEEVGHSGVS